jgi:hypothetical protein
LSDTREVGHYSYAQIREMFRWPDARKHEEFRAVVSAGGEDDFMLAAFLSNNAALNKADTDCTVTGEDDPFDPRARSDRQSTVVLQRIQKGVGCATPPTIGR